MLIDSVYRKDKNYYPQVILEKHNFIVIEKKMSNINDNIDIYSDEEVYSYNVYSHEEYSDDSDEGYSDGIFRGWKVPFPEI